MNKQIPPLKWARLTGSTFGEGLIVFTYHDRQSGLSCKGFFIGSEDAAVLAERPLITVRLAQPKGEFHLLSTDEISQLGLPELPAWLKHYGQQPKHWGSWFSDPLISTLLNPDYPCDLIVSFAGLPEEDNVPSEEMWVRLFDREDDTNFYIGNLLNQPNVLKRVRQNDEVRLRIAPGSKMPVFVGERELHNLERYKVACQGCGFDMLSFDVPALLARSFPDLPTGEKVRNFTTRCRLCNGPMWVDDKKTD